ncbi:two-component system capsular synthesis response regulator RcsB [Lysobacter niastensis]|uniref:Two-component system capsular synthesis response regulator RcsB n=1 Tax=Lysobacter niastensis TaxID=380629 RepID=A0ABU1WBZ7_9GAMM|nr:response regulator transcription factor [Lysobacter niastensis]MDR7135001.1 two-component system capsular synthesis response regulator RcsB [Lysobacter niastensis]
MTMRIILADDHPIIANGVRQFIEQESSRKIVAIAASTDELISVLEGTPCDLLITDFSMPGREVPDGLPLLSRIRKSWPGLPIIVLTRISNPAILRSIRDVGVRGLISKSDAMPELLQAIHSAMRGGDYLGKATKALLETARVGLKTESLAALSPREAEVLRLLASGMNIKQISRRLNRSPKTISNQKLAAMDKLGIRTDLEIYAYVSQHGMMS